MGGIKNVPAGSGATRQFLIRIGQGLARRIKILAIDTHTGGLVVVERAVPANPASAGVLSAPQDRS